jgi:hypothetical protein
MMKAQKVSIRNVKWDRPARKAIITIGNKELLNLSFGPSVSTEGEMEVYKNLVGTETLDHVHVVVTKLFSVNKTIKPLIEKASNAAIDSDNYTMKNTYLTNFLESVTIIIDPATDSLEYEAHTKELSTSEDVPFELRKIAKKILKIKPLKFKKKKEERKKYRLKKKETYEGYWRALLAEPNKRKLQKLISDTLDAESKSNADVGLPPVPVIDSLEKLEWTKEINRIALAYWPKNGPQDNCATYLIIAPEVLSDEFLVDQIIEYIGSVDSKFIVFKFKNLELDTRGKVDEKEFFKKLLNAIVQIKHEKKDERVFVLLEAGLQFYAAAAGGFDIVSTSISGHDGDWIFRPSERTDTINGWFDMEKLFFRNDRFIRKKLENGGFRHKDCPACKGITDYASAKRDWHDKKRIHYVVCVNQLLTRLYGYIDQQKIELAKSDLARSEVSNLKHILPLLDHI